MYWPREHPWLRIHQHYNTNNALNCQAKSDHFTYWRQSSSHTRLTDLLVHVLASDVYSRCSLCFQEHEYSSSYRESKPLYPRSLLNLLNNSYFNAPLLRAVKTSKLIFWNSASICSQFPFLLLNVIINKSATLKSSGTAFFIQGYRKRWTGFETAIT